jgi:hypothetical protein
MMFAGWLHSHRAVIALVAVAGATLACSDTGSGDGPNMGITEPRASVAESHNDASSSEVLASTGWQETARTLVSQANMSAIQAARAYPVLGVAQYLAVQRAGDSHDERKESFARNKSDKGHKTSDIDRGAVAGASVVTLSYLFPAATQALESTVAAQAAIGSEKLRRAFATGEAIGRAVGAEVVTRAIGDGFDNPNTATPPAGPDFWTSSANPPTLVDGGQLQGVTSWFLRDAKQFRPPPPPAFGSAEFNAALAEIRQLSDNRTSHPEYTQIATYWALSKGTPTSSGFWLDVASKEIAAHGLSERRATHLYALMSATMFDAQIGCWDAKLTYWLIRPWKADPAITTVAAVGKPNHPSFPSGHSCLSASGAEVLSTFFPEKRAELDAMVDEAGMSRMYGGIHYRFDIDAGQRLGRNVALFTIKADATGHSVLAPSKQKDRDHKVHDGRRGRND